MEPEFIDREFEPSAITAPGWMVTFADLLSLLLAFFVLLFATTSIDRAGWQRVFAPISTYMGGRHFAAPGVALTPLPARPRHDSDYVAALLDHLIATTPSLRGAVVERREHAIVLGWPTAPGGQPAALADMARLMSGLDNRIEIRVHMATGSGPRSIPAVDWERPLLRAAGIAAEIGRLGGGRPVAASGTADLPAGADAETVELLIFDAATEVDRAAP